MKVLDFDMPRSWRGSMLAIAGGLAACSPAAVPDAAEPRRIVSLDYCADQYVLQFSDREDILALSPDAEKHFSYLRNQATGLAKVRPRTADILALEPDLVVRSYGGDPGVTEFLERAGVSVIQLGYPRSLEDVREEVLRIGSLLGEPEKARAVVDDMDERLSAIRNGDGTAIEVLYVTPGGVSAGRETLINEMFEAAGMRNYLKRSGWHDVPLEQLAYDRPDLVAAAFFESDRSHTGSWSAARHPLARDRLHDVPVVPFEGAWTSCGAWFLVEAIEALDAARDAVQ